MVAQERPTSSYLIDQIIFNTKIRRPPYGRASDVLNAHRIRFIWINAELLNRLRDYIRLDLALIG